METRAVADWGTSYCRLGEEFQVFLKHDEDRDFGDDVGDRYDDDDDHDAIVVRMTTKVARLGWWQWQMMASQVKATITAVASACLRLPGN